MLQTTESYFFLCSCVTYHQLDIHAERGHNGTGHELNCIEGKIGQTKPQAKELEKESPTSVILSDYHDCLFNPF